MIIFKDIVFLIIGFVLLIKGADFFVDGSSSIATKLKVPPLIIGLTIVAMGTSLPELSVSVVASIEGSNSLSVSNALGSNIFNLLMVLGITAIIAKIDVEKDVLKRDFPISILCAVYLLVPGLIAFELSRVWGVVALAIFALYLIMIILVARKNRNAVTEPSDSDEPPAKVYPVWASILFIIGGAVAIKFGGDWVVDSAVDLAGYMGMSETFIGLTIVSVGTSLPELVTSIVAARKGQVGMAVGNVVGSNIFNLLLILGCASTISPITLIMHNIVDVAVLGVVSIIGFIFCLTKKRLSRIEGIIMVAMYAGYMAYILMR